MNPSPKSNYSYDELIACGHGELFGPGNARLPLPNMLMFHRITHISAEGGEHDKGIIKAELDIDPSLWFFDHQLRGIPVGSELDGPCRALRYRFPRDHDATF